ncbi:hypothetical protein [Dyella tabacisoli]|uniref:Uncharacterized protein n=1 Tax=Dyella tabacisoli TaxID=2282381 RepID=A0A369UIU8_9GAMM|nr:hypothetical protein [Dyella tabacisoli]RDD80035.1 hypothetical protein DVJ77_19375 [Dyella tabacisoli]
MKKGYWFRSRLFRVEPGEDDGVNPGMYGRQLALWLKEQLESHGQPVVDVISEDFGWCVRCQVSPFLLWIGCGDVTEVEPSKAMPTSSDPVWHCFPAAEASLIARLFKKHDMQPALSRLDVLLREILMAEPAIQLIEAS